MIFNSIDFAFFLPLIFTLYWALSKQPLQAQNILIVIASYVFYGWWDVKFLILIFLSTVVDYSIGIALSTEENVRKRKLLLWCSILVNLGILGFFKYSNFFLENFVSAFSLMGKPISIDSLSIVLPVGISFYTFQTLSYTIDVYRRKLEPTKDFVAFTAFVSFFPQLVAGPIERASNLLPQFYRKRTFEYAKAVDGLRQILWGLFKKIVVADNCAEFANIIFNDSDNLPGGTLALGALFFAFQIYADFSGYSDIAIGTARLFGFDMMQNFAFPYFSRDVGEFWRRWHISLSTWFRDYLYIPLGGSKGGIWSKIRNTFIIFIVSGFWHGANWTFVIWGALNAFYFIPLLLTNSNRNNLDIIAKNRFLPHPLEALKMVFTFGLILISWVFFRAEDLSHALRYLSEMFSSSIIQTSGLNITRGLFVILVVVGIEWFGRKGLYAIEKTGLKWPKVLRWFFYASLVFMIAMFMQTEESPFIYFQF